MLQHNICLFAVCTEIRYRNNMIYAFVSKYFACILQLHFVIHYIEHKYQYVIHTIFDIITCQYCINLLQLLQLFHQLAIYFCYTYKTHIYTCIPTKFVPTILLAIVTNILTICHTDHCVCNIYNIECNIFTNMIHHTYKFYM